MAENGFAVWATAGEALRQVIRPGGRVAAILAKFALAVPGVILLVSVLAAFMPSRVGSALVAGGGQALLAVYLIIVGIVLQFTLLRERMRHMAGAIPIGSRTEAAFGFIMRSIGVGLLSGLAVFPFVFIAGVILGLSESFSGLVIAGLIWVAGLLAGLVVYLRVYPWAIWAVLGGRGRMRDSWRLFKGYTGRLVGAFVAAMALPFCLMIGVNILLASVPVPVPFPGIGGDVGRLSLSQEGAVILGSVGAAVYLLLSFVSQLVGVSLFTVVLRELGACAGPPPGVTGEIGLGQHNEAGEAAAGEAPSTT